ncbi:hypothetical protein N7478_003895 [Penicillium angulare]|uniref:uncharacterized protein n=1 Tax=Penicillium angulare TaxID=116970 RepID=UPI0025413C4A|nr:uncharacterized protein N7478_003895 [Penicillium angulare]KAJ5288209.1 hypothetical protein N7478_003895 [Penicillium angulare]
MSKELVSASRLKPELRLAQAVSLFEADLPNDQKLTFRTEKSQLVGTPPSIQDVLRLTAQIDEQVSVSKRRCFGTRIINVLESVQQFAALGDIVVGGSQNLIACGVWTVVRTSLVLVANYSSYLERLSTLFMIAGRSAPRYEKMALLYPRSKSLQSYLCDYFIVLVQLCHKVLKFTQKSALGQFKTTLNETDLKYFQVNLENCASQIKGEVTLLMAEKINDEALKASEFQNALWKKMSKSDNSHQIKINARIQVLSFCSKFDHTVIWKQTRKSGTTRLFNQTPVYEKWKGWALSFLSRTLVYTGKLGSGKSVMLANIVDDLHLHANEAVVYFFCRHDVPASLQARTIIGSLARQILSLLEDLTGVAKILSQRTDELNEFDKIEAMLQFSFPSDSLRLYIVLDGLDDCDDAVRIQTMTEISKLQRRFHIRLCVSFRSDPASYGATIEDKHFVSPCVTSIPDNSDEIRDFILEELEDCLESQRLMIGDPTLILEIRDALFSGSEGMYLWVVLQIETLCSMRSDYEIRQALLNLPKSLTETFCRILQQLQWCDQQQGQIMKLILAARRPLTIYEIQEALSVVPGEAEWDPSRHLNNIHSSLATCGCLIHIDEEEMTARLVHPSLKQFLAEGIPANMGIIKLTAEAAHQYIAEIIITYLSYNVFDRQVSRCKATHVSAGSAPSNIINSTFSSSSSIRTLAVKLLRSKTESDFDLGKVLGQVQRSPQQNTHDDFCFHAYAKSHWHIHMIYMSSPPKKIDRLLFTLAQSDHAVLNSVDETGRTPLMRAIYLKNTYLVELLTSIPEVDLNIKSFSGSCAVHIALFQRDNAIIARMLHTADPNTRNQHNETPLLLATTWGDFDLFRLVFDIPGIDVAAQNKHGEAALHIAVRQQRCEIVACLLGYPKINVNIPDNEGDTPLHIAVRNEDCDIVRDLLGCENVQLKLENKKGQTALWMSLETQNKVIGNEFLRCWQRLEDNKGDTEHLGSLPELELAGMPDLSLETA